MCEGHQRLGYRSRTLEIVDLRAAVILFECDAFAPELGPELGKDERIAWVKRRLELDDPGPLYLRPFDMWTDASMCESLGLPLVVSNERDTRPIEACGSQSDRAALSPGRREAATVPPEASAPEGRNPPRAPSLLDCMLQNVEARHAELRHRIRGALAGSAYIEEGLRARAVRATCLRATLEDGWIVLLHAESEVRWNEPPPIGWTGGAKNLIGAFVAAFETYDFAKTTEGTGKR